MSRPKTGMMNVSCCMGCTKRKLNCHDKCKTYQEEKELNKQKAQWLREQNKRCVIYPSEYDGKIPQE